LGAKRRVGSRCRRGRTPPGSPVRTTLTDAADGIVTVDGRAYEVRQRIVIGTVVAARIEET
jgi:hypothetical protein